jgi:hypothetical protein
MQNPWHEANPPSDVEMDTMSIQEPQDADTLGIPPSTSQPDLAVAGEPTSEMVEDKRKPGDNVALDAQINDTFKSTLLGQPTELLESTLLALLKVISKQIDHEITLSDAENMANQHGWLRDFLVAQWHQKSFTKVRRLSECPLCIFPVNTFI